MPKGESDPGSQFGVFCKFANTSKGLLGVKTSFLPSNFKFENINLRKCRVWSSFELSYNS